MTALVGEARFHHAAVVVSSLARSIEFYQRLFGGSIEMRLDDVREAEIAQLHGLDRARFDLVYIGYGGARIELFQFHDPLPGEPAHLAANEIGSTHLAFEVPDVRKAYERLTEEGVTFARAPVQVEKADGGRLELVFLSDPDGNRIELLSGPVRATTARPAKIVVLPVDAAKREEFLELAIAVLGETESEVGAEQYALHEEDGAPNTFWLYERYIDEEALTLHREQPALRTLLASLQPLLSGAPKVIDLTTHSSFRS